ncbi:MAG: zinc ribbon domain-containing protein [Anaerolineales bacterium]
MALGSFFLLLALLVVIALFVSRPFFESGRISSELPQVHHDHMHSTLLAERDQILNSIHELDLDFELGKMPLEEYQLQRGILLKKGADILKELDGLPASPDQVPVSGKAALEPAAGTAVQPPAIMRRVFAAGDPNDELEALIANRRRSRNGKASGFCPKCGSPLQKSDQFCPKCGFKLPRTETQQG